MLNGTLFFNNNNNKENKMKQIFENQLAQIWKKWLIVEKHSGKLEFEINDFFFPGILMNIILKCFL